MHVHLLWKIIASYDNKYETIIMFALSMPSSTAFRPSESNKFNFKNKLWNNKKKTSITFTSHELGTNWLVPSIFYLKNQSSNLSVYSEIIKYTYKTQKQKQNTVFTVCSSSQIILSSNHTKKTFHINMWLISARIMAI